MTNSDNLTEMLQKGFRVTLGATSFMIETLQDSQKRDENLAKLKSENLSQLTDEWAQQGELTEREARNFVDTIFAGTTNQDTVETPTDSESPINTPATTATESNPQVEIQELTAQMAALRAELEKLRTEESQG
jgi:polyhydroxyalkanoate synthesis regulator phasin